MSTQARDAKSMDAFITLCPFCCARSSTYTLIRSAWPILCTTSYVCQSVSLSVRLSACPPVCTTLPTWHRTSRTFHNKTLYPYDCYDGQKKLGHVRRAGGVKTIMWNMSILGLKNIECFHIGLPRLARRLYCLPLQCDGSHGLGPQAQASAASSHAL